MKTEITNEETGPELLKRLGTDASLWAKELNKTAINIGYSSMDEGWLIGWFANAMMAMYDANRGLDDKAN